MPETGHPIVRVLIATFHVWWDDWVNWFVCSLLLILAWLTVILGPPATLGFYHVAHHLTYGKSLGPKGMVVGAGRYFLTAWLWGGLNLVAGLLIYADFWFYGQLEGATGTLLMVFSSILLTLWLLVQFYALPYLIEQERRSVFLALRNGLFSLLAFPGYSLALGGLTLVIVALSLRFVVPAVLGALGFAALLGTWAVRERLGTHQIRVS